MPLRSDIQIVNGRIVQTRQTLGRFPQLQRAPIRTPPRRAPSQKLAPDQQLRVHLVAAVRSGRLSPSQANAVWRRAHPATVRRALARPRVSGARADDAAAADATRAAMTALQYSPLAPVLSIPGVAPVVSTVLGSIFDAGGIPDAPPEIQKLGQGNPVSRRLSTQME